MTSSPRFPTPWTADGLAAPVTNDPRTPMASSSGRDYADALVTADRHAFFKFMVAPSPKSMASATFMPKPFAHLTGNGCRSICRVVDAGRQPHAASSTTRPAAARQLVGDGLSASLAACWPTRRRRPTSAVNSYKRLNAQGIALVRRHGRRTRRPTDARHQRVGGDPRPWQFELRLADGAEDCQQHRVADRHADGVAREARSRPSALDIDMYSAWRTRSRSPEVAPI